MRDSRSLILGISAAFLVTVAASAPAFALADLSQTTIINEDDGFPGVCGQPCYSIEKTVEVFLAGNPAAPAVCGAGENTYVYTLTNLTNPPSAATLPFPGIPLTEFEATVDFSLVASAGFIPGAGVAPVSTTVSPLNVVNWSFPQSQSCPGCLTQGLTSEQLYICSTAGPGSSPNNVSTTAIILDAPHECIVPVEQIVVGEPMPCTIGFWKNRVNEKKGTIQWFPGTDIDDTIAEALSLSMGVFTSATGAGCPNFDDMLCALTSKGNRSTAERARQQLAATLLNLAAGDLFPENGKCGLYEENNITSNACGNNLLVGDGVATSKTGITSGISADEHLALECLDDINNEIGVVQ